MVAMIASAAVSAWGREHIRTTCSRRMYSMQANVSLNREGCSVGVDERVCTSRVARWMNTWDVQNRGHHAT